MENFIDNENQNNTEENESQDLIMQILGRLAEHDKAYRKEYFESIFADQDVKFGFIYMCSSIVEACKDLFAEKDAVNLSEEDVKDILALEDVAKDVLDFVGLLPETMTHEDYVESLMQSNHGVPAIKNTKIFDSNNSSNSGEKVKKYSTKTPVLTKSKIKQTNTKPSRIIVPYQRG